MSTEHVKLLDHSLNCWATLSSEIGWNDDDPPANSIFEAQLRAKNFDAENITYRHFLRVLLGDKSHESLPSEMLDYARKCVYWMKRSCQAFMKCTGRRVRSIATNCWATSHA